MSSDPLYGDSACPVCGHRNPTPGGSLGPGHNYWHPGGAPFAVGMAVHGMDRGTRWCERTLSDQLERERRYPDNLFIQNAREADALIFLHLIARSMPCHDRPERFVRMSGTCGRPDGGHVQPHALWAMESAA